MLPHTKAEKVESANPGRLKKADENVYFILYLFIYFLLCSLLCNFSVTLAVSLLYPVTTRDTFRYLQRYLLIIIVLNSYCFMYLEVLNIKKYKK